jgi:DNA ligase 1
MTLLANVVAASREVAETSARSRKVAILAELLRTLERDEVAIATGLLSGISRQGRIGVGYATVYGLEQPPAATASLAIVDLDHAITAVQAETGSGSATRRRELLADLLGRATSEEADFIRRLFTGELRQGALAGIMVDAVAKAAGVPADLARRAFMLSGDLTRTAETALAGGEQALRAIGFELFQPVLPMLASTAETVADALTGFDRVAVEWKLDGIRIQIHRRGDEVRIYTRNLNDITHALPGIVEAVLQLPVRQAVLDGEALWMSDDGPAPFQDTVARIDNEARPEGIATFLFDLLHVDGEDLLDTPLEDRSDRLAALAPQLKIPGTFTSDSAAAQRVLDDALRAGHEGVVVKDAASLYAAGRRGKAWLKVKPVQTYDLVVLGAEWGHGRRQGRLSNLHLGARDAETGAFVMVGKTFKGMTDELLQWQTQELLQREVERRGIAVFVRPELVVEIALDGVQASTRYPGGVALRFARVKRYRPDKRPEEADTIDALRALLPRRAT